MQGIETKDYVLLVYGFLLSIPAGLVVFWLSNVSTKLFDSRSKRIRLGRLKAEQDRLRHVTGLKHSNLTSAYATIECTHSLGYFISGAVIIALSFALIIFETVVFGDRIGIPISTIASVAMMITGVSGVVSGWRKYARLCGDLARAVNYDDYKASVDKLTQELSAKSKTP